MAIIQRTGNVFKSKMQTIAVTVNVVGAMGKGVALECKKRYPETLDPYLQTYSYANHSYLPYEVYLEKTVQKLATCPIEMGQRQILFFPTKQHWRYPSKLSWIEANLLTLAETYQNLGITSLALPALGCGNGGLQHEEVFPRIHAILGDLDLPIDLYA